jgi:hypothetical protein
VLTSTKFQLFLKLNTSNSAPKEELARKTAIIVQQRLETRNLVIAHCLDMSQLNHLHSIIEHEEDEEQIKQIGSRKEEAEGAQLAIEAAPNYSSSTALIKQPIILSELDATLNRIQQSPKDMIKISESVIDPLVHQWTRLHEFPSSTIQNFYELHAISSYQDGFYNTEGNSPENQLVETTTADLRKDHAIATKEETARRKEKYAGLQPTISERSSGEEDDYAHRIPKKRPPTRHVIDSSSGSSDSEPEVPCRRRRSYPDATNDRTSRYPPPGLAPPQRYANSDERRSVDRGGSNFPIGTPSPISPPRSPESQRSVLSPAQGQYQRSYTSPLPPLYTSNVQNPYSPHSPHSPHQNPLFRPPAYQNYTQPQQHPPNYAPRYPAPQGYPNVAPPQPRRRPEDDRATRSPSSPSERSRRSVDEGKKAERSRRTKNAARGAVGGGVISGLWETLEGLEF